MKTLSRLVKRSRQSRDASILVCVLVCLAVSTALATSAVKTALVARRTMRTQHHLLQADQLLAAGVERANQNLQSSSDYSGEVWTLAPETLPGMQAAVVQIKLENGSDNASPEVHVTARLEIARDVAVQRSHRYTLESSFPSEKE